MLTRRALCSAVLVSATLASFLVPLSAQVPNVLTCPRLPAEDDDDWSIRCAGVEGDRRAAEFGDRLKETARQRAIAEKLPLLPAARNRLLGRWQPAASGGDPIAQLLGSVSGCGTLIGEGIVEFEPARWAIHERGGRRDLGAVSYRAGSNGSVIVLPVNDGSLMPFEFQTPDRIHWTSSLCTLVRTNAAVPSGRASGSASAPSSRATGARPAQPGPPAPRQAPAAAAPRLMMIKDSVGYQCPDGQQLAIQSCDRACLVVRVDQPPRNGFEVTFIEEPDVLLKRVASCTQRRLVVKNGALALVP